MISKILKIKIEIDNISVGRRYFSFDYKVFENGKIKEKGQYDSSHSRSHTAMRKWLRTYYAYELIMQKIYG